MNVNIAVGLYLLVCYVPLGLSSVDETNALQCDLKAWYMDALAKGLLDIDSDTDDLKSDVMDEVLQLVRRRKGLIYVDCAQIENYDQILKTDPTRTGLGNTNDSTDIDDENDSVPHLKSKMPSHEETTMPTEQDNTETDQKDQEASTLDETGHSEQSVKEKETLEVKEETLKAANDSLHEGRVQNFTIGGQELKEDAKDVTGEREDIKEDKKHVTGDRKAIEEDTIKDVTDNKENKKDTGKDVTDGSREIKEETGNDVTAGGKTIKEDAENDVTDNRKEMKEGAGKAVMDDSKTIKEETSEDVTDDQKEIKDKASNNVTADGKEIKEDIGKNVKEGEEEIKDNTGKNVTDVGKEMKVDTGKNVMENEKEIKDDIGKNVTDEKEIKEEANRNVTDGKETKEEANKDVTDGKEINKEANEDVTDGKEIKEANEGVTDGKEIKDDTSKNVTDDGKDIKEEANKNVTDGKEIKDSGNNVTENEKEIKDSGNNVTENEKEIRDDISKNVTDDGKDIKEEANKDVTDGKEIKEGTGKDITDEKKETKEDTRKEVPGESKNIEEDRDKYVTGDSKEIEDIGGLGMDTRPTIASIYLDDAQVSLELHETDATPKSRSSHILQGDAENEDSTRPVSSAESVNDSNKHTSGCEFHESLLFAQGSKSGFCILTRANECRQTPRRSYTKGGAMTQRLQKIKVDTIEAENGLNSSIENLSATLASMKHVEGDEKVSSQSVQSDAKSADNNDKETQFSDVASQEDSENVDLGRETTSEDKGSIIEAATKSKDLRDGTSSEIALQDSFSEASKAETNSISQTSPEEVDSNGQILETAHTENEVTLETIGSIGEKSLEAKDSVNKTTPKSVDSTNETISNDVDSTNKTTYLSETSPGEPDDSNKTKFEVTNSITEATSNTEDIKLEHSASEATPKSVEPTPEVEVSEGKPTTHKEVPKGETPSEREHSGSKTTDEEADSTKEVTSKSEDTASERISEVKKIESTKKVDSKDETPSETDHPRSKITAEAGNFTGEATLKPENSIEEPMREIEVSKSSTSFHKEASKGDTPSDGGNSKSDTILGSISSTSETTPASESIPKTTSDKEVSTDDTQLENINSKSKATPEVIDSASEAAIQSIDSAMKPLTVLSTSKTTSDEVVSNETPSDGTDSNIGARLDTLDSKVEAPLTGVTDIEMNKASEEAMVNTTASKVTSGTISEAVGSKTAKLPQEIDADRVQHSGEIDSREKSESKEEGTSSRIVHAHVSNETISQGVEVHSGTADSTSGTETVGGEGPSNGLPKQADSNTSSKHKVNSGLAGGHGQHTNDRAEDSSHVTSRAEGKKETSNELLNEWFVSAERRYSEKILSLELQMGRMENHLLKESIDVQSKNSAIDHLEKHILRLETQLLRFNQTFRDLQSEHEKLLQTQKAQMKQIASSRELAERGSVKRSTDDQSSSTSCMTAVQEQQNKIRQLSEIVEKQTLLLDKLQDKFHQVESDNHLLVKQILNQSILMNEVLVKMDKMNQEQEWHKNKLKTMQESCEKSSMWQQHATMYDRESQTLGEDDMEILMGMKRHRPAEEVYNYDAERPRIPKILDRRKMSDAGMNPNENGFDLKISDPTLLPSVARGEGVSSSRTTSMDIGHPEAFPSDENPANTGAERTDLKRKAAEDGHSNERMKNYEIKDALNEFQEHKGDDDRLGSREDMKPVDDGNVQPKKDSSVEEQNKENEVADTYDDGNNNNNNRLDESVKDGENLPAKEEVKAEEVSDKTSKSDEQISEKSETDKQIKPEKIPIKHLLKPSGKSLHARSSKECSKDQPLKQSSPANPPKETSNEEPLEKSSSEKPPKDSTIEQPLEESSTAKPSKESSNEEPLEKPPNEFTIEQPLEKSSPEKPKTESNIEQPLEKSSLAKPPNESSIEQPSKKSSPAKQPKVSSPKSPLSAKEAKQPAKVPSKEKAKPASGSAKSEETLLDAFPDPPIYATKRRDEMRDCYDHYSKGRRHNTPLKISPGKGGAKAVEVYCDMKNEGWTVIQRRQDGSVDFLRNWNDYKNGFGSVYGEHWIGNDAIHLLTNQDHYSLRVELTDWDRNTHVIDYDRFRIADESDGYRIFVTGYSDSPAGDSLTKHHGNRFSTMDVDNDLVEKEFGGNCARRFSGAWWYFKCYKSNLNGKYYRGGTVDDDRFDGVAWKSWTGSKYSLKKVELKIRPRSAAGVSNGRS